MHSGRYVLVLVVALTVMPHPLDHDPGQPPPRERGADAARESDGHVRSADGVPIGFTSRGAGDTVLLFIHGGLADRTFWTPQLAGLSDRFRVVALDLAGHGASGRGRRDWTLGAFGDDVRAVAVTLEQRRIVLIGNSLGGPVALEAARQLPGRAIGVVGVDTFHDLSSAPDPAESRTRAEAFRKDFGGACRAMIDQLFHPGAQPELRVWAEGRMCAASPDAMAGVLEGFAEYDLPGAARAAGVPIRAINGDLWPVDVERNRALAPGFEVLVMKRAGHYPMLERPEEFNRLLVEVVRELESRAAGS
jgi:pimeloyl-ACP methyl ester carboxylesterase